MKLSGLALGTVLYPLKLVSTRLGVMDTPIDVDEDSQWKHDSEFVKIVKHVWHMFYIQFFKRNQLRKLPKTLTHFIANISFSLVSGPVKS